MGRGRKVLTYSNGLRVDAGRMSTCDGYDVEVPSETDSILMW